MRRPGLDKLLQAVARREVDMVLAGQWTEWVAPCKTCLRSLASFMPRESRGGGIGKVARTLEIDASYVQRVLAETEPQIIWRSQSHGKAPICHRLSAPTTGIDGRHAASSSGA
jgi:hypothetical protein